MSPAFVFVATLLAATPSQAQFRTPAAQELWIDPSVERSLRDRNYTAIFSGSFLDLRIAKDVSRVRVVVAGDETNAPIETTVGEIREALRYRRAVLEQAYKSQQDANGGTR